MKLTRNMIVKNRLIPLGVQCMILNSHLRGISKFEIASYIADWLDCHQFDAIRIVDSVIGVSTSGSNESRIYN